MSNNVVPIPSSPSAKAKAVGLKNLKQVSNMTGVSEQTLINWCNSTGTRSDKTELFNIVLLGCVSKLISEGSTITFKPIILE